MRLRKLLITTTIVLLIVSLAVNDTNAQSYTYEFGIGIGSTNFLGDLGKNQPRGDWYYHDLNTTLFRPGGAIFFRSQFHDFLAFKVALGVGWLEGNDKYASGTELKSDDWFRNYRNLHFRSYLLELSGVLEGHFMRYRPGSMRNRFTPVAFVGIALFNFNPRAKYNGEWVSLRPLRTEGQGLPEYEDRKMYSLIQPAIPFGIGIKYNVNRKMSLNFDFGHRITFTDYIDDVSTTYPDPDAIANWYEPEKAAKMIALSNRSVENDPEGEYGYITGPEMQRGSPDNKDAYLFSTISLAYQVGGSKRRTKVKRRGRRF